MFQYSTLDSQFFNILLIDTTNILKSWQRLVQKNRYSEFMYLQDFG